MTVQRPWQRSYASTSSSFGPRQAIIGTGFLEDLVAAVCARGLLVDALRTHVLLNPHTPRASDFFSIVL